MKVKINCKSQNNTLQLTKRLVLLGKIKLSDIPFYLRTSQKSFYIMAMRYTRGFLNSKCFINVLNILLKDIINPKNTNRANLIRLLEDSLMLNPYSGDENLEIFKKSIPKEILQQMRIYW